MVGIFAGPQPGSLAQGGVKTQPVEVTLWARGLSVMDSQGFLDRLQSEKTVNIIIRNQPYGQVNLLKVAETPRSITVTQPDGTPKVFPDPRPEALYTLDMFITVGGEAQITPDGPVLGNSKLKVGTPVELDGQFYNFNTSVVDVKVLEPS